MDYAAYRARGLQIGSGSVESGCKQLVTARLKQAGMIWSADGAAAVATVRAWLKSDRWAEALAVRTIRQHKGQVAAIAFSPDRRTLATGSWDETIRLWDLSTGLEKACFSWKIGKITTLAYSPDGTRLAAGSLSGSMLVWDTD